MFTWWGFEMKFDSQDVKIATRAVASSAVSLDTMRYVNQVTSEAVDLATRLGVHRATEKVVDQATMWTVEEAVVTAIEPGDARFLVYTR